MTFTVLSPYQVFFIDEAEKLWTVLKDGRMRVVSDVPAFSNISAGYQTLSGVEFNGEYTVILSKPLGFASEKTKKLFRVFGYCYYPTTFEQKHPKVALLKADLLNHAGTADLIVYEKKRIRYHPQFKMSARIIPPKWDKKSGLLYYITAKGILARTDGKTGEKLAESAELFCLNRNGTMIAYYDSEYIYEVALDTGNTRKIMAFNVTALGYGVDPDELFFATSTGESHIIQKFNKQTNEVELIARCAVAVKMIG